MRYINLHFTYFTYLLTYLHSTYVFGRGYVQYRMARKDRATDHHDSKRCHYSTLLRVTLSNADRFVKVVHC